MWKRGGPSVDARQDDRTLARSVNTERPTTSIDCVVDVEVDEVSVDDVGVDEEPVEDVSVDDVSVDDVPP